MNFASRVQFLNVFNTTTVDTTGAATNQTTGVTAALSTAGSSGTGNQTSSYGGYPYGSIGWDMAGYEGALVVAHITSWTTGLAGSNATLQIYASSVGTTSLSTTYIKLNDAYTYGMSSTPFALVVDVNRPKARFLQAQVQVPSSSQVATVIDVIRYGEKLLPSSSQSVLANDAPTGVAGARGALGNSYTSFGATT